MTREETILILGTLRVAFPRFYANISKEDALNTVNLWSVMFKADAKEDVELALYKMIATNIFPPTISEVRMALNDTNKEEIPDAGKAWGEVLNMIREYGYPRGREALDNMTEATRKVVNYIGWDNICKSENLMADRAHFLKMYDAIKKREMEKNLIPLDIQKKIQEKITANAKEKQSLLGKPMEVSENQSNQKC